MVLKAMKCSSGLTIISLASVVLMSACVPSPTLQGSNTAALEPPEITKPSPIPAATLLATTEEVSTLLLQPIATSRGPELEATDPATVHLASGAFQLIEFFRFT